MLARQELCKGLQDLVAHHHDKLQRDGEAVDELRRQVELLDHNGVHDLQELEAQMDDVARRSRALSLQFEELDVQRQKSLNLSSIVQSGIAAN